MAVLSAFFADQQRDLANEARTRAEVEAETAKQTTNFMVGLFNVADPSEARGNSITAREIMDKGAARIDKELTAQPAIQATLMETMGAVYTSLGLYDQAVPLLRSALDKRRALYGDKHLEVARSMDRLCEVLKLKAEYEPAQRMCREALAMRREMLGNEHVDTARSVYELADLLGRMGDFTAAEPLFREALTLRRKLFKARSPEVAQSLEGLALNLYDQGNFQDSVSSAARRSRDAARAARRTSSAARGSREQSRVRDRRNRPEQGSRAAVSRSARDEASPARQRSSGDRHRTQQRRVSRSTSSASTTRRKSSTRARWRCSASCWARIIRTSR